MTRFGNAIAFALTALGLAACNSRDADVPVVVVMPGPGGIDPMQGVQSLRLSVRKGTPGGFDMQVISDRYFDADVSKVSIKGVKGGRDRFVVLEGLDLTRDQIRDGGEPVVLARGATIPEDHLPGGTEPPASGAYPASFLFFGRVGEMSPIAAGMLGPRAFFGSTVLASGNVVVAGGLSDGEFATPYVEVFHRDGAFYFNESPGGMTAPRAFSAMAAIGRRGAIIAGGVDKVTDGQVHATAERFDEDGFPVSQPLSMGSPRMHLTAVSVDGPNGEKQAVIAGGASSWDVTDAKRQAERWDGSQFLPYQPLLVARASLAAASLFDGTALLTGGFALEPFGTGTIARVSDSAELLDTTEAGSPYSVVTGMRPHWAHSATTLQFGDVLVSGGSSTAPDELGIAVATSSADLFLADFEGFTALPPLAAPRAHHAAAPLADGRAIVCGGTDSAGVLPGSGHLPFDSCEILGPDAAGIGYEWSPGPALLEARYGHAMFPLGDGSVLVVGGVGPGDAPIASAEIYTPTWPEPE